MFAVFAMNEDQQMAVSLAKAGHSLLITGSCGTGKSTVLREIVRKFREDEHKVLLCASTGMLI
jgi:putative protein kinase ArgK-like GTPase of G3E family